ncbi:MAG: carbohydrate ABC transporter permease [Chloroflexia bacterium]|nr:carbohydrate ABC transporter permease [Chloroflexia bacterium]MDQ3412170.1 carbohydrate ABC transporter permease [Chloroflexota bacterium]
MSTHQYTTPVMPPWLRVWTWVQSHLLRPLTTRVLLWALLAFFFIPILWTVMASLKTRMELYTMDPHLLVQHPTLANYLFALEKMPDFALLYRNSLIVTLGSVVLQTALATLAGYGFARLRFRGRDLIFYTLILLIFVPRAGGLMAQYELMNFLGLRDNLFGLILAFSAGLSVPIFIMRQAFLSLPRDFEDAAMIDGCNRFQAFWTIMVPMVTGAMVVVALFEFIRVWGEYLFTLTMIDDQSKFTLGIGMVQQFSSATIEFGEFTSYGGQAAAYIMAAAPAVLFFLGLQRWFVRGLLTGLKL